MLWSVYRVGYICCGAPLVLSRSLLRILVATPLHARALSDFNPNKFRHMQFLIREHERKGHKVLVFSDNISLLQHSARTLNKPFIYGKTSTLERQYWLRQFNDSKTSNCLFISSVGDTSLDLPDVNVVIQISSHFGS